LIVASNSQILVTPEQEAALRARWPNVEWLRVAFALALDVETCGTLLLGLPVSEARLDRDHLKAATDPSLVRLRPVDVLLGAEAKA
jgi:hypothetical protein